METDCLTPFDASISVDSTDAFRCHGDDVADSSNNDGKTTIEGSRDVHVTYGHMSREHQEIIASDYQLPVTDQTTSGAVGVVVVNQSIYESETKEQSNSDNAEGCVQIGGVVPETSLSTEEHVINIASTDITNDLASPMSATIVDVPSLSAAVIEVDRQVDVNDEWRQSNLEFESHGSSVCSIDTVKDVEIQHQIQHPTVGTVMDDGRQTTNTSVTNVVGEEPLQSTASKDQPHPVTLDQPPAIKPEVIVCPEAQQAQFTTGRRGLVV